MAKQSTAAATDPTPTATPSGEPVAPTAEPVEQEPNVNAQFEELKNKLAEFEVLKSQAEAKAKDSEAKALRNEAMYKGLQNQTTKTLQQAAEDRKRLEQLLRNDAELAEIKEMLNVVSSRVLDEDEKKDLQYRQRELRLKLAEQAVQEAAKAATEQSVQTAASPSYESQENVKAQFLEYYFPGVGIDPNDSGIDWGEGSSSQQDAFRRFTVSVTNLKNKQDQAKTQDAMATIQAQTSKALEDFKLQQAELLKTTSDAVEKAKVEAIEQARIDSEKKLRRLGADVPGTPAPDSSGQNRTLKALMEEIPDSLLQTAKGREEFNRRMEQIRATVRGR